MLQLLALQDVGASVDEVIEYSKDMVCTTEFTQPVYNKCMLLQHHCTDERGMEEGKEACLS